jgi:hypothetical protein
MGCTFGESVSKNGSLSFDVKFIKLQSEVASEELGDEFVEEESQILSLAGDAENLLNQEYFIRRAQSIVRCLQARYLGDCSLSGCTYKKEITELIEESQF